MTPRAGVYFDISLSEYLSWDALSKSGLVHFAVSPAQYLRYLQSKDEFKVTDAMLMGTAVDILIFDGSDAFRKKFFRLPAGVARRAGTMAFDIERSKNPDKRPLTASQWDRAFSIADALQSNSHAMEMIERSYHQVSWLWREPITGVSVKGRYDMWQPPWSGDLKVTNEVTLSAWRRTVRNFRHDWQAALYCRAMSALTCEKHTEWDWLTVKDKPEHSIQIFDLDPFDIQEAWGEILEQLETFRVCKETNTWPASSGVKQTVSLRRKP